MQETLFLVVGLRGLGHEVEEYPVHAYMDLQQAEEHAAQANRAAAACGLGEESGGPLPRQASPALKLLDPQAAGHSRYSYELREVPFTKNTPLG